MMGGKDSFIRRIFHQHSPAPEGLFSSVSLVRTTSHGLLVTQEGPAELGEIVVVR